MEIKANSNGALGAKECNAFHKLANNTPIQIEWHNGEQAKGIIVSVTEYSKYGSAVKVNKIKIVEAETGGVYARSLGRKAGSIVFFKLTTL